MPFTRGTSAACSSYGVRHGQRTLTSMLLRCPPPRDAATHAKPVVSPNRSVVTLHARAAMAGSAPGPEPEPGEEPAHPPAAPCSSCAAIMPATPVAQSVQLYEKRIAFTRWRAAVKSELPGFAAVRLCPAPGDFAGSGAAHMLASRPEGAPGSCVVAGANSGTGAAVQAAQREFAAGGTESVPQEPPEHVLPISTGGRRAGAGAFQPLQELQAGQRAVEAEPPVSDVAGSTVHSQQERGGSAPEAEQAAARPARRPARGSVEHDGGGEPLEGPCDAAAEGLGAVTAAAEEAGEAGGSLAEAALAMFGDPAMAARCQAALRGTHPAALASLAADGGSALAAQHTIAALTGPCPGKSLVWAWALHASQEGTHACCTWALL